MYTCIMICMHGGKSGMFSGKVGCKPTWDISIKA